MPKVRVGRKAITNIQTRLGEVLRYRPMQESISVRLDRASAVIRGWSNYFKIAHNFSQVAHGLDHKAFWIAVKAICRKEDISTAQCLRKYRLRNTIGVHEDCTLARFQDTASTYYYSSPEPYQPGCNQPYPEDDEWEAAFVFHERRRPGCGDLKWKALVRDGFHCRGCAVVVTSKTSHADHIEPVNRFANLAMANDLDNIQTLVSALPQAQNREGKMRVESSGKPDAWKLARPVWGWGRGETPRPTPPRNLPAELETIVAHCLAHARRQFVDVVEQFPEECRYVLESLAVIYRNDAIARQRNLSPAARRHFHQTESGPTMAELHAWLVRQFDERLVEPNSSLGKAISYMLKHRERLTLFLRVPGAPLDNNICERAEKGDSASQETPCFTKPAAAPTWGTFS